MLTPQDIREKVFEKAVFGGYDMAAVDDFLEEVSNDYASLYKENTVLKSKIKVLVEKVEEYRSSGKPCAWPASAQKLGVQIENSPRRAKASWPPPRKRLKITKKFAGAT